MKIAARKRRTKSGLPASILDFMRGALRTAARPAPFSLAKSTAGLQSPAGLMAPLPDKTKQA
jgi:hypothetical protein